MARIPYFDPAQAQGRAKRQYERLPGLNIFRMLGHSGEMLDGFVKLGGQILNFADLDPVLRDIDQGPDAPVFSELQRQVMAFTDDIVVNKRAGDATFDPLCKALGYKQIQELVITIGYYMMVSCFLETFDVDIEAPGAEPPAAAMPGVGKA